MHFSLLVRMAWEKEMKNKQHTTTAGEDYLESVLILQKKLGMVRSVDGGFKTQRMLRSRNFTRGRFFDNRRKPLYTPDRPWPGCG